MSSGHDKKRLRSIVLNLLKRESGGPISVPIAALKLRQHAMKLAIEEVFGNLVYVSSYDSRFSYSVQLTYAHTFTGGGGREPPSTGMIVTWDERDKHIMKLWIERPGLSAIQFAQQVCEENPTVFSYSRGSSDASLTLRRVDRVAKTAEDWNSLFFEPVVEEMIWIIFRHSFIVNALAECSNIHINAVYLRNTIETMLRVEDVKKMTLLITRQPPAQTTDYVALEFKAEADKHIVMIKPYIRTGNSVEAISIEIKQILEDCFLDSKTPNRYTYEPLGANILDGLKMRFQRKSDIYAIKSIVLTLLR
jgi:hypothetical protein